MWDLVKYVLRMNFGYLFFNEKIVANVQYNSSCYEIKNAFDLGNYDMWIKIRVQECFAHKLITFFFLGIKATLHKKKSKW